MDTDQYIAALIELIEMASRVFSDCGDEFMSELLTTTLKQSTDLYNEREIKNES